VAGPLVLWDFDGTLAHRAGMWSGAMIEVLDAHEHGHGIERERARAAIRGGFPWHAWEQPHAGVRDWWGPVEARIARAFTELGVAPARAAPLARAVRERYVDAAVGWALFDDTLEALRTLAAAGWRSAVLSNHVPELGELVGALGLAEHLEHVFSSALTGYEKPHPEAFRLALEACGNPALAWMVGDNPHADVWGAEAVGLRAILVRSEGAARLRAPDAAGAVRVILASAEGSPTP